MTTNRNRCIATALIFFFFLFVTMPSIYFLIQVVAFVPVVSMLASAFQDEALAAFGIVHFVGYLFTYAVIASILAWAVNRVERTAIRKALIIAICVIMTAPAFFRGYVIGGEGQSQRLSWMQTFKIFNRSAK